MRVTCASALVALSLLGPFRAEPDPFGFFRPDVIVTGQTRARLEAGAAIVSVLHAKDRDLAVFSAIELPSTVTPERFLAWLHNIAAFRKNAYVVGIGRFSAPPQRGDIEDLALDDADLQAVHECRPGDCGLKLSSPEMQRLRGVIDGARPAWKPAVQKAFRDIVMDRVQTYMVRGHAGFGTYSDRKRPRSPAGAFSGLVDRTSFLAARAPLVWGQLADEDGGAAEPDSYFYWSKEQMGHKTVISATHVTIFRGDRASMPDVLMTGKQIFATHYLDACLGVTGLVRDRQTSRTYLVYVNRSDVDLLGGFWGRVARQVIEDRIQSEGPALLRDAARKLASGDPPPLRDR